MQRRPPRRAEFRNDATPIEDDQFGRVCLCSRRSRVKGRREGWRRDDGEGADAGQQAGRLERLEHRAKWPRDVSITVRTTSRSALLLRSELFRLYSPLSCSSDVYFFTENDIVVSLYVHLMTRTKIRLLARSLARTLGGTERERGERGRDNTGNTTKRDCDVRVEWDEAATKLTPRAITMDYCRGGSATVLCLDAQAARACHLRPWTANQNPTRCKYVAARADAGESPRETITARLRTSLWRASNMNHIWIFYFIYFCSFAYACGNYVSFARRRRGFLERRVDIDNVAFDRFIGRETPKSLFHWQKWCRVDATFAKNRVGGATSTGRCFMLIQSLGTRVHIFKSSCHSMIVMNIRLKIWSEEFDER